MLAINSIIMANQMRLGAVLSYASIAVNLIVGLTYTPFMLRMMGPSEYGLYSLAASIISYLTVLDLGFGNAIVRYTAKFRAEGNSYEQEKMFGMFTMLYSVIAIIAIIIGGGIISCSETLFGDTMTSSEVDRTKIILMLLTFNVAITFPLSIWGSIMSAYERFVFPKIVSIVRSILNALVMVILLIIGYRAIAMVVLISTFNIITLCLNWVYCKKVLDVKVRFAKINWALLKEVSMYSFWIFLNVLMDKVYWSTGQIILGTNSGTIAISQFAIAVQLLSYYMLLNVAISNMLLPRLTTMVVEGADSEISRFIVKVSRLQYILIALILSGFIVFGKQFVIRWAGAEYEKSYYISLALMIPMTVDILLSSCVKVLQARNQMKYRSIICLVSAILCVFLQIPLSGYYGALGCALAITIVFAVQIGILSVYFQKHQKINIVEVLHNLLKMSIIPTILIVAFGVLSLLFNINNIVSYSITIIIFSVTYITLQYYLVFNEYERSLSKTFLNYIKRK